VKGLVRLADEKVLVLLAGGLVRLADEKGLVWLAGERASMAGWWPV